MRTSFQTSGDLRADRRFAYACDCASDADFTAAVEMFEQVIELAPHFAPAWFELGKARLALGRPDARAAFQHALELEPQDRLGAGLFLARLGDVMPGGPMSEAYIRDLFEQYAARFDRHLSEGLQYRGPIALFGLLTQFCLKQNRTLHFSKMLDLGCGTGLAGVQFVPICERLEGCDLAPAMLGEAARKDIYHDLQAADAITYLNGRKTRADLVLAADMLPYFGDLGPLFKAVAERLAAMGLFVFSTQLQLEDGDYHLGADLRYAHSIAYIETAARRVGLFPVKLEVQSVRREAGIDIPSLLVILSHA